MYRALDEASSLTAESRHPRGFGTSLRQADCTRLRRQEAAGLAAIEKRKAVLLAEYGLVFCCRKRCTPESLAAQWIQGFMRFLFLFFCAFFTAFPNPYIDILTKQCANRYEKRAVRQHSPLSYFSLMICSYSMAYFFSITILLW